MKLQYLPLLALLMLRAAWWRWALASLRRNPGHPDLATVTDRADQAHVDLQVLRWDMGCRA